MGSGKLPAIAGQVGRVVRDFRRTTAELSSEFNRTLSLEIEERKVNEAPAAPPPPPPGYEAHTMATEAAPVAAEPAEAPPVAAPAPSMTVDTPVPAAPVAEAPVASKRRTIDADLAPPY